MRLRPSRSVLGILAALCLVAGVAGAQPRRRDNTWIPITGTSWSFDVPPDWQNVQPPPSSQPGTMIVSTVTAPPTPRGRFPNVTLVLEPFSQGDGRAYGRAALQMVSQIATILSSREVSVGGRPGFDIEAQWPNNQPPTHALQRVAVSRGFAHIVTCSDTVEAYPRSAALCHRLLDTFRVR